MKRKVIAIIFLIIILVFFRQYIINAADEAPKLGVIGNIDDNKNITINFKATNIKGIQCKLSYDNEVLEYIDDSLQGKNNWAVGLNSETLLFLSGNMNNIEETDIATIQFRPRNETDTIQTNISLTDIKIVKANGEQSTLQDTEIPITINRDVASVEENIITEESKPKDDEGNEITESQSEEDKVIDYGSDLEDTDEGTQANDPVSIKTDDEMDEESKEIEEVEEVDSMSGTLQNSNNEETSSENNEITGSKEQGEATINNSQEENPNNQTIVKQLENLSNKILPKTGIARIMLPIIAILIIVSVITYKKFKAIKKI